VDQHRLPPDVERLEPFGADRRPFGADDDSVDAGELRQIERREVGAILIPVEWRVEIVPVLATMSIRPIWKVAPSS
jgi:hypothetical protein